MTKGNKKSMLSTEQVVAISTGVLGVIQIALHIWSDIRRQQQTRTLMARPIHLEITLTDVSTESPKIEAKMSRK